eukprot:gene27644-7282_t
MERPEERVDLRISYILVARLPRARARARTALVGPGRPPLGGPGDGPPCQGGWASVLRASISASIPTVQSPGRPWAKAREAGQSQPPRAPLVQCPKLWAQGECPRVPLCIGRSLMPATWTRYLDTALDNATVPFPGSQPTARAVGWLHFAPPHPQVRAPGSSDADVTQRGISLSFLLRLVSGRELNKSHTIQQLVDRCVVAATERTLFCLDKKCTSLTRIWCLYEVWQTFITKGVSGLLLLASTVDTKRLEETFKTFDVREAQATQAEDRDRILQKIDSSIGATELNLQLKAAIVDSAVYEAQHTSATGEALYDIFSKAGNLLQVNGRYAEAEALFHQTLEARTLDLGPDHPDTLGSINNLALNLALCINDQGRFAEAEPYYHQAVEGHTRVFGPDHSHTLGSINGLAECINEQGRSAEAEPWYLQALEGHTRMFGPEHPSTLASINNLALCINDQGRHAEAEPLFLQTVEGMACALGPDHPFSLMCINGLASCILKQGRSAEAEPLFRQAVEGMTRVLGPDHPATLVSKNSLAISVGGQGRHAEAEPLHCQAVEATTRALGPDHPQTLGSINGLATCMQEQGRHAEAEPLFYKTVEAKTRVLGPEHPSTLASINNLALCLNEQGRHAEVEPLFHQALDAWTRVLGPEHPSTLASINNLARCINEQGRHAEAEPLFHQALEARTRVLGPEHPDTGTSMCNLAEYLKQMARVPEACAMFLSAARVFAKCYGPNHSKSKDAEKKAAALADDVEEEKEKGK